MNNKKIFLSLIASLVSANTLGVYHNIQESNTPIGKTFTAITHEGFKIIVTKFARPFPPYNAIELAQIGKKFEYITLSEPEKIFAAMVTCVEAASQSQQSIKSSTAQKKTHKKKAHSDKKKSKK